MPTDTPLLKYVAWGVAVLFAYSAYQSITANSGPRSRRRRRRDDDTDETD